MPEPTYKVWSDGTATFAGVSLGGLQTLSLTLGAQRVNTKVVGDSTRRTVGRGLGDDAQVVIRGLVSDYALSTRLSQRNTLIYHDSAGTTRFTCAEAVLDRVEVTEANEDATVYNLTFGIETLPSIPDVTALAV